MSDKIRIQEDQLRSFSTQLFQKVGLNAADAHTVSDALVFANLRGIDSHGILRLPFYLKRLEVGGSKSNPNISTIKEKAAYALLDGDNGMGQVIGAYAARMAAQKAKEAGISFIAVRGSAHFGAASYYSNLIAKENMIGFATTNTTQIMAAWGGSDKILGNNPIAISVPKDGEPLVLDISMSRVAGGKIKLYAKDDKKIPLGWGLDKEGRNTTDPNEVINGGAYLPFGEHKGYGLAVILEILNGVLTGASMLSETFSWWKYPERPLNLGHCFAAINIEDFIGLEEFSQRLTRMSQEIKASSPAEGSSGVVMPGEIEDRVKAERSKEGIPVSPQIVEDLKMLSEKYDVPFSL